MIKVYIEKQISSIFKIYLVETQRNLKDYYAF